MRLLLKLSIFLISATFILEANAQDNDIMLYINKKDWSSAQQRAKASGDIALLNLVLSQKFLDTKCNNSFGEVVKFLNNNPHWPQAQKIKEAAESYLNNTTNKKLIVEWFGRNKPKTGNGYKFYALAASSIFKEQHNLTNIIKDGWIYGDFTKSEEHKYLKDFAKHLTKQDHINRIDEHLWKSNIDEAKHSMRLVDEGYKESFSVAIAAMKNDSNTDDLFHKLSPDQYTSSLLFYYLKYKKSSKAAPDDWIFLILQQVKNHPHRSSEWSKIQLYWAREFLYARDYTKAYKIASSHFASKQDDMREAEWHAGWIALRFLHKPKAAEKHFNNFVKIVTTPISLARGYYWLGRTEIATGNTEKAKEFYKMASKHSYTFYGQLAITELKESRVVLPHDSNAHDKNARNNKIVQAIEYLINANNLELATLYTKTSIDTLTRGEMAYIANAISKKGNLHYTTEFAKLASQKHVFIKNCAFPTPYKEYLSSKSSDTPISYGIIRQESVFNQHAVSNRDAMGLMQLIEDTACKTAKSLQLKCDICKLTKDPQYNIKLGTKYFKELLKERDGSYILALASYNTSGANVNKWIKLFGDPREIKDINQVVDWLELIPFHETRNFVQRVLENMQVYKAILNKNHHLNLKQQLLNL